MDNTLDEAKGLSAVEAFYSAIMGIYDLVYSKQYGEDAHSFFLAEMFSPNEESAFEIIQEFCKERLEHLEGILFNRERVIYMQDSWGITLYSVDGKELFIEWDKYLGCPMGGYWL